MIDLPHHFTQVTKPHPIAVSEIQIVLDRKGPGRPKEFVGRVKLSPDERKMKRQVLKSLGPRDSANPIYGRYANCHRVQGPAVDNDFLVYKCGMPGCPECDRDLRKILRAESSRLFGSLKKSDTYFITALFGIWPGPSIPPHVHFDQQTLSTGQLQLARKWPLPIEMAIIRWRQDLFRQLKAAAPGGYRILGMIEFDAENNVFSDGKPTKPQKWAFAIQCAKQHWDADPDVIHSLSHLLIPHAHFLFQGTDSSGIPIDAHQLALALKDYNIPYQKMISPLRENQPLTLALTKTANYLGKSVGPNLSNLGLKQILELYHRRPRGWFLLHEDTMTSSNQKLVSSQ